MGHFISKPKIHPINSNDYFYRNIPNKSILEERLTIIKKNCDNYGTCPICYEDHILENYYTCNHFSCSLCYTKWRKKTCSLCRSTLNEYYKNRYLISEFINLHLYNKYNIYLIPTFPSPMTNNIKSMLIKIFGKIYNFTYCYCCSKIYSSTIVIYFYTDIDTNIIEKKLYKCHKKLFHNYNYNCINYTLNGGHIIFNWSNNDKNNDFDLITI